jgi:hypothetical protein
MKQRMLQGKWVEIVRLCIYVTFAMDKDNQSFTLCTYSVLEVINL